MFKDPLIWHWQSQTCMDQSRKIVRHSPQQGQQLCQWGLDGCWSVCWDKDPKKRNWTVWADVLCFDKNCKQHYSVKQIPKIMKVFIDILDVTVIHHKYFWDGFCSMYWDRGQRTFLDLLIWYLHTQTCSNQSGKIVRHSPQ